MSEDIKPKGIQVAATVSEGVPYVQLIMHEGTFSLPVDAAAALSEVIRECAITSRLMVAIQAWLSKDPEIDHKAALDEIWGTYEALRKGIGPDQPGPPAAGPPPAGG